MKTTLCIVGATMAFSAVAGGVRTAALEDAVWKDSQWISVKEQTVNNWENPWQSGPFELSEPGTSWFAAEKQNAKAVKKATWMTTGLGVYDVYVNGELIGDEVLKPGFTDNRKTKRSFTYDVTALVKKAKGEKNVFAAAVSSGWWRDKIVNFIGKKSAFRGVVRFEYDDGSVELFGTDAKNWKCGLAGKVTRAGIFDGEWYDNRKEEPTLGQGLKSVPEINGEFKGVILPSEGAEVYLRRDLALKPVDAYVWKGFVGAKNENDPDTKKETSPRIYGKVNKLKTYKAGEDIAIRKGEQLVVDFGQNCAAVPEFQVVAKSGTVVTVYPGEMLNEGNGERSRGNDWGAGTVYRENLRQGVNQGFKAVYTAAGTGVETYAPRYTFFGYRYAAVEATEDIVIKSIVSVPVTSITRAMELGKIETGDPAVNKLIANVYWGQLSNYLSVPTDCPQRDERQGWTADTQVFAEAGSFNANTSDFLRKFMRDVVDAQHDNGGFTGVAPFGQYGNEAMRFCWADVGVIVPYQMWKQFGDVKIITDSWAAMEKYMKVVDETKYETMLSKDENYEYQWADWLSFEDIESCAGPRECGSKCAHPAFFQGKNRWFASPEALYYWNYLGACYWLWDARMMKEMAAAIGKSDTAKKYDEMAKRAKDHLLETFFGPDGLLMYPLLRTMQTPAVFALKLGLVEGEAKAKMIEGLRANFKAHGDCLQTGFLGTSMLMDTLTDNGLVDICYTLLLQHKNPSWLYSVDQGATTIWERWNSYTKKDGFGEVGMNSFNHYAYGCVLAWIYKTAAGISATTADPGFKTVVMAPKPDKRLGSIKAEYRLPSGGVVKSAWKYEGEKWVWNFTVPAGSKALVTAPGETVAKEYRPGDYKIIK